MFVIARNTASRSDRRPKPARAAPHRSVLAAAMLVNMALSGAAGAATGEPVPGSEGLWRDFRGANNVGIAPGDRLTYRLNIEGGSAGGTITSEYRNVEGNLIFASSGLTCGGTTINPAQCGGSVAFSPNRTAGTWSAVVVNPTGTYAVSLPSVAALAGSTPMPLVTDVRISGAGATPTFTWSLPSGAPIDEVRVSIFDNAARRADRADQSDVIFAQSFAPSTTSFTVPSVFGQGLSLAPGGDYTLSINLRDTRNGQLGGGNFNLIGESRSFLGFTPLAAALPAPAYLPQVIENPGAAPLYQFGFGITDPAQTYYIDPATAIGYRYRTGNGDPNFASVLLPQAGDDDFLLSYLYGGQWLARRLQAGDRFFFPQGGVSAFDVGDIEESAGLDPFSSTAFVTGLTFTGAGMFTGTMEPVVAAIPLPAGGLLMASGIGVLAWCMRRRRSAPARVADQQAG